MSIAQRKAGNFDYALDDRFWELQHLLQSRVSNPKGLEAFQKAVGPGVPNEANKELVRCFADFMRENKAKQTKVEMFHSVVTFDKTVSIALALQTPENLVKLANEITEIVSKHMAEMCQGQFLRTGAQGKQHVGADGLGFVTPHLFGSLGQIHLHFHDIKPNVSFSPDGRFGAIGNAKAKMYDMLEVTNARIQKDVSDLFRGYGIATELSPDSKHVRVSGIPQKAIDELSVGKQTIEARLQELDRQGDPRAAAWAALDVHNHAKRAGKPTALLPDVQLHAKLVLEKHGVNVDKLLIPEFGRPGQAAAPKDEKAAKREAREADYRALACVTTGLTKAGVKHTFFSKHQLREEVLLEAINQKAAVPNQKLEQFINRALKNQLPKTVDRVIFGDHVRYCTPESLKGWEKFQAQCGRHFDTAKELAAKVAESVKTVGTKLILTTAAKAAEVIKEIATKKKPVICLHGSQVPEFIRNYEQRTRRMSHLLALRAAVVKTPKSNFFNVIERLENAEAAFRAGRVPPRLEKGTEIVVSNGDLVSLRDQEKLKKIAARNKSSLSISEVTPDIRAKVQEQQKAKEAKKEKAQEQTRHEFRGRGREQSDRDGMSR